MTWTAFAILAMFLFTNLQWRFTNLTLLINDRDLIEDAADIAVAPLAVTKARAEVTLLVAFSGQWIFALHMFYRVSQTRLRTETKTKCCGAKFSHGYDLKVIENTSC